MNFDEYPFTLENHGCDLTYDAFHTVYVGDYEGALAHKSIGGWAFISAWTNAWDAQSDIDANYNTASYDIKPISIHMLVHMSPAIVLDGVPMLVKSTNMVDTQCAVLFQPRTMYPDATMLWCIAIDKETHEPVKDKDGNPYADVNPFSLMTSVYKGVGAECVDKIATGQFVIVMYTLMIIAKLASAYNVRGDVYDPSIALAMCRQKRAVVEDQYNV